MGAPTKISVILLIMCTHFRQSGIEILMKHQLINGSGRSHIASFLRVNRRSKRLPSGQTVFHALGMTDHKMEHSLTSKVFFFFRNDEISTIKRINCITLHITYISFIRHSGFSAIRINLSPFTKDFRAEEHNDESIDLFFSGLHESVGLVTS